MYKTVRHGENSLQYTILPQNDDFRIEGKLSTAGSNCSAAAGRKGKPRRPRRRSFFAYLGLIFVCTVIIGAILVPFLVSAECLPNPTEWFLKTKAALSHGGSINRLHRNGGGPREVLRKTVEDSGGHHLAPHNSVASIGQKVEIINSGDGIEKIILRVNKTQAQLNSNETKLTPVGYVSDKEEQPPAEESNAIASDKTNDEISEPQKDIATLGRDDTAPTTTKMPASNIGAGERIGLLNKAELSKKTSHFVTEVRFDSGRMQSLLGVQPTIVVTTTMPSQTTQNGYQFSNSNVGNEPAPAIRPTTSFSTTSIYSPHAPAAASAPAVASNNVNAISNQNTSAVVIPTITTRIMQLPLLKSTAKKPIIPPVLVRPNSEAITPRQSDNNAANNHVGAEGVVGANDANGSVKVNAADIVETKNADWIQSHWPYIDPSTYFQWTGYKEDSVLLPALLGFALTGMILIIAVCLVARNKRAIVSSVRKRNRNDIEEAGADDNTTLLTNANLSDED